MPVLILLWRQTAKSFEVPVGFDLSDLEAMGSLGDRGDKGD